MLTTQRTIEERNGLIVDNATMCAEISRRFWFRCHKKKNLTDLESIAGLALVEAAGSWPGGPGEFRGWAIRCIWNRLISNSVCDYGGLTYTPQTDLRKRAARIVYFSFDRSSKNGDSYVFDGDSPVESTAQDIENKLVIDKLFSVARLSPQERADLDDWISRDASWSRIAAARGVSKATVQVTITRAITKLKLAFAGQLYRTEAEETLFRSERGRKAAKALWDKRRAA